MSFYESTKSTIDKIGMDLVALLPDVDEGVNLDSIADLEQFLASPEPSVVWNLASFSPDPAVPLYKLIFNIGAKTTSDISGVLITRLISAIHDQLRPHTWIDIKDYSGASPPSQVDGSMFVQYANVDEQETDKISGLRMISIVAGVIEG